MRDNVDYVSLARQVFDTCLGVKPEDRVWINSWDHTLELAKAFASECTSMACPFLLSIRYEDLWLRSIRQKPKQQLESVAPQDKAALAETDCYVFTMGPRRPIPWGSIPEEKREAVSVWLDTRYDKTSYARKWARIARAHKVKMLAIEATLATPERAKAQGLKLEEWRDVVFRGCMADHREIARRGKRLEKLLSGKGSVRITTPSGTRLSLALDRRPVGISDGVVTEEMAEKGRIAFLPAGAAEVSVDEESVEGRIVYDTPVRLDSDAIEGLVIDLRDGRIQQHTATRGADLFDRYLERGGRDAGRFAFFGLGLNPKLQHGFTQDDKVLGCLTLGFGSNTTMGGKNIATDQWWASMTGTVVTIDDTKILENGKLLV